LFTGFRELSKNKLISAAFKLFTQPFLGYNISNVFLLKDCIKLHDAWGNYLSLLAGKGFSYEPHVPENISLYATGRKYS